MRQDGHHGRHQRAARTQGRTHAAGHHPRLPRRPAHCLPEPPAPVRPQRAAAGNALRGRGRGRRARRRRWRSDPRPGRSGAAPRHAGGVRQRHPHRRHRLHARLARHRPRAARRPHRARDRFHPGIGLARGQPADQVRLARRYHGGRCLPVAHPQALRRPGGQRAARHPPDVHAIERRPDRRAPLPRQGRHPVRPGRRHRRHGAHQRTSGF